MAIYETIFIMDSLVPPKDIDASVERFSGIITDNGGTIRKVDKWGKKRLAYEIEKKQYGYYVSIEFEGKGNIPALLESDYNFNDKVLRYLTYHYDKNKLKVMKDDEEVKKETAPPPKPKPEPVPVETPAETTGATEAGPEAPAEAEKKADETPSES